MLDEYLIENYGKLKEISLNIAGIKEQEDLLVEEKVPQIA